jgi:hypothetical protein
METASGTTSLDVLKLKYPHSIISHRVLEELYKEDPSPDKKLFHWMVQQNIKSSHKEDVNNNIIRLAQEFYILRDKMKIRDINFYHTADILQNEINHVKAHLTKAEKRKFKIEEGGVIYEDLRYRILHPTTLSEICNAGFDTEWCSSNHYLPGKLEDYLAYVILDKQLKHPDVKSIEDYVTFGQAQELYFSRRKIMVLFAKSFKGDIHEADLDDYLLVDASNELLDESISDVSNHTIENTIFEHFREHQDETVQLSLIEQFQNEELKEDDRVELVYMKDKTRRKPQIGEKGTVQSVEQTPHGLMYHMKWDNGSTLALLPDEDVWKKIGNLNEATTKLEKRRFLKGKTIVFNGEFGRGDLFQNCSFMISSSYGGMIRDREWKPNNGNPYLSRWLFSIDKLQGVVILSDKSERDFIDSFNIPEVQQAIAKKLNQYLRALNLPVKQITVVMKRTPLTVKKSAERYFTSSFTLNIKSLREEVTYYDDTLNESASKDQIESYIQKKFQGKICYMYKGEIVYTDKFPQSSGKPGKLFKYFTIDRIYIKKAILSDENQINIQITPHNMHWTEVDRFFGMVATSFRKLFGMHTELDEYDSNGKSVFNVLNESTGQLSKSDKILKALKIQYTGKVYNDEFGEIKTLRVFYNEGSYFFPCSVTGYIDDLIRGLSNDVWNQYRVVATFYKDTSWDLYDSNGGSLFKESIGESSPEQVFQVIRKRYEGQTFTIGAGHVQVVKVDDGESHPSTSFRDKDGVWFHVILSGNRRDMYKVKEKLIEDVMKFFRFHLHWANLEDRTEKHSLTEDESKKREELLNNPKKTNLILGILRRQYDGKTFKQKSDSDLETWGEMTVLDISLDEIGTYVFKIRSIGLTAKLRYSLSHRIEKMFNIFVSFQEIPEAQ